MKIIYQILGITCDNASANDAMIDSLAAIMLDFPGEANRARCLAHIINLVVKVILRQFDVTKKKEKNNIPNNLNPDLAMGAPNLAMDVDGGDDEPDITEGDIDELVRELDKEEKEMDDADEADDEDSDKLLRDVENIEDAMEGEIKEVSKMAKPLCQVLFKVCPFFFFYHRSDPSFFFTSNSASHIALQPLPPLLPFFSLSSFFFHRSDPSVRFYF